MKKLIALLFYVMLLCSIVGGCAENEKPDSAKEDLPENEVKYKEELIVGNNVKITTLNPQGIANAGHGIQYQLTHESLVHYNTVTSEIEPRLAKSWELSKDGKTYTFKLRDDVYFHNGEKLTADDIIFTIEFGKEHSPGVVPIYNSVVEAKAVDDHTLELTLKSPNMDFLINIGSCGFYGILNRKAVEADPDDGPNIGTGPWVNKEFEVGNYNLAERNEEYWGEKPVTKRMRFRYIPENSARLIALETDEIDLCLFPANSEWELIENNKDIELFSWEAATMDSFVFNTTKVPGNDLNLRLAIAYALNYEDLIDGAYEGYGKKCNTFWNPKAFGYFDDWASVGLEDYNYNMDMAKGYMAKSKYSNGVDLRIAVNNKERVLLAQIIQAQLKPLGINIIVEEYDTAGFSSMATAGLHESLIVGMGISMAPDDIRRFMAPGSTMNRSRLENPRVLELMDLAVAETDDVKRIEYYKELQIIIHEECPQIPMFHKYDGVAYHKDVSGGIYDNRGYHELAYLKREIK